MSTSVHNIFLFLKRIRRIHDCNSLDSESLTECMFRKISKQISQDCTEEKYISYQCSVFEHENISIEISKGLTSGYEYISKGSLGNQI